MSLGFKADGKVYYWGGSDMQSESLKSKFEKDDIVGCGWNLETGQVFFTVNGRFVGSSSIRFEAGLEPIYPSVCLQSKNEEVKVNLKGKFTFDIESFK